MVKPDFEDRYNADKHNSSHLDIHPGLASSRMEMWLADLRSDEIMNMVSNLASTFSEIEDLQKLPAHKQCALVVDWLWKYGVPLNAPNSMSAKDIHEVLTEPLQEDSSSDAARKLPAALLVATGKEIARFGTRLSTVPEFLAEAKEATRSTSPALDSSSNRASPTSNRAPQTWCWPRWIC